MFDTLREHISRAILRYLSKPTKRYAPFFSPEPEIFRRALEPGDIVLIEGNTRLSAIIKFLTQSTWSHASLYLGDRAGGQTQDQASDSEPNALLEADVEHGVTTVPLSKYLDFNKRICRPVGLSAESRQKVIDYALSRRGKLYDFKANYRPGALSISISAGACVVSPAYACNRQRRSDQSNLLNAYRGGLCIDTLSNPAGGQSRQRQDLRGRAIRSERG